MTADPIPQPKAAMLTALAGAMLLASLGTSIATVALPGLARAFPATVAELQWVVLAYLLAVTVTIVVAGRLGDLHGDRRLLIGGLAVFTLASTLCAASNSLAMLIAARALQGLGGAVLMAMPMSIARNAVAAGRTGIVMGMLGTMSAIGTGLGPSLGGILMENFGWQAAFLLLTGAGVVALVLAVLGIPKMPAAGAKAGMDWRGTALLAIGLGLYALAMSGASGAAGWGLALLVGSVAVLWLFARSQRHAASPLVPMSMLADRVIGPGLVANLLVGTVMMATLVVGALFLSFALRLDGTQTGLVMAVGPITAALVGVPAGALADRLGPQRAMMIGLGETCLGLVALAFLPGWFGMAGYVGAVMVLTPGFQLFLAANNANVMLAAPSAQRGMVSGLLGLSRNLGLLTGASAMATLFAWLIGDEPIASAAPDRIGMAFTVVFLVAAGLAVVSAGLMRYGRRRAA